MQSFSYHMAYTEAHCFDYLCIGVLEGLLGGLKWSGEVGLSGGGLGELTPLTIWPGSIGNLNSILGLLICCYCIVNLSIKIAKLVTQQKSHRCNPRCLFFLAFIEINLCDMLH